jgi:N-acetylmuramoyl-L-alanine amidase
VQVVGRVAVGLAAVVLVGCGTSPAPAPITTAPVAATTTTAVATTPAPPQRVVVLDPGHNGGNGTHTTEIGRPVPDGRGGTKACNTTGTATDAGYPEHAFTWDVAQRVRRALEADGVRVVLTRPDDTGVGPCVDERGRAGEAAGADAVVSIHADGASPGGSGFHVALSDPPLNSAQGAPARELALAVRDAMRTGGFADSDYTGEQALTPRADLAGLNHSTRPAVLVECANMRNAAEAALVSSEAGRERYADAIAAGILTYLG